MFVLLKVCAPRIWNELHVHDCKYFWTASWAVCTRIGLRQRQVKGDLSNMLYLGHLTVSFWHQTRSVQRDRGHVLAEVSAFTSSKQQRWHYVAGQLHVWQDYSHGAGIFIIGQTTEARAAHEDLAVESADGHRPWLLSECEMPKPDCSSEPGGQRRKRLLSPTHRASKTIWHEDFIPHLKKKNQHPPTTSPLQSPPPPSLTPAFDCLHIKAGCTVKQKHVLR